MSDHDADYYRQRADAELRLAKAAQKPEVRKVHETLAEQYRTRAAAADRKPGVTPGAAEGLPLR